MVLEKTLESPLDSKEIQPVYPKGNLSWIFIGRTDAEAETPVLWPPDAKNQITGKDPVLGKIEGGRRRGWHGWMASPTQWIWVWVSSRSWWWTGKPDVLRSVGSQRVRYDWVTELSWTELVQMSGKKEPLILKWDSFSFESFFRFKEKGFKSLLCPYTLNNNSPRVYYVQGIVPRVLAI